MLQEESGNRMRMYKCDRCGKLMSVSWWESNNFIRNPTRGVYRFGKKRHLCPSCVDSFYKWITAGNINKEGPDETKA